MNSFYSRLDMTRIENRDEGNDTFRTPFQRDRDRIIHSEPFRRLQNKTQVLFPGEYDFYRTRLTHTIEVAQLGRTIAHFLNRNSSKLRKMSYIIDMDLIEAICLAHDIGHPPFGHLGEHILNQIMDGPQCEIGIKPYQKRFYSLFQSVKKDVGDFLDKGFEANAQNLRIVENLAYSMGHGSRAGFNPTFACWEGLIKYRFTESKIAEEIKKGHSPEIKFIYDSSYCSYSADRKELFNQSPEIYEYYNFRSLENQIMELADDIAYSILDVEDAYKSKFLGIHNLDEIIDFLNLFLKRKNLSMPYIDKHSLVNEIKDAFQNKVSIRKFKNKLITWLIEDLHLGEVESYQILNNRSSQNFRFSYKIEFSRTDFRNVINFLKDLVKEFVYTSPYIKQMQYSYPIYVLKLFEAYFYEIKLLPKETQSYLPMLNDKLKKNHPSKSHELWSKSRIICDYISGMTDHYFLRQYKNLFSVDNHPLLEII